MISNIRHEWVAGGKLLYWRIKPGPQKIREAGEMGRLEQDDV